MIRRLYHGTCRAFVEYALQNKGKFGPDQDSVSFTPEYEHARMFADSWQTPAGRERLRKCFENVGNSIEQCMEPVVLVFDPTKLPELKQRDDCGHVEFFLERGPVSLDVAKEIK